MGNPPGGNSNVKTTKSFKLHQGASIPTFVGHCQYLSPFSTNWAEFFLGKSIIIAYYRITKVQYHKINLACYTITGLQITIKLVSSFIIVYFRITWLQNYRLQCRFIYHSIFQDYMITNYNAIGSITYLSILQDYKSTISKDKPCLLHNYRITDYNAIIWMNYHSMS